MSSTAFNDSTELEAYGPTAAYANQSRKIEYQQHQAIFSRPSSIFTPEIFAMYSTGSRVVAKRARGNPIEY